VNVSMWDILKAADEPQVRPRHSHICSLVLIWSCMRWGLLLGHASLESCGHASHDLCRIQGALHTCQPDVACDKTIWKQVSDCAR
jgi:hypothetical protein